MYVRICAQYAAVVVFMLVVRTRFQLSGNEKDHNIIKAIEAVHFRLKIAVGALYSISVR